MSMTGIVTVDKLTPITIGKCPKGHVEVGNAFEAQFASVCALSGVRILPRDRVRMIRLPEWPKARAVLGRAYCVTMTTGWETSPIGVRPASELDPATIREALEEGWVVDLLRKDQLNASTQSHVLVGAGRINASVESWRVEDGKIVRWVHGSKKSPASLKSAGRWLRLDTVALVRITKREEITVG